MKYDPVKRIMINDAKGISQDTKAQIKKVLDSNVLGKTPGAIETVIDWIDYDLNKLKKDVIKLIANKQEVERLIKLKYVDDIEEQKAKDLIDQINKEIISFKKRLNEISSVLDH